MAKNKHKAADKAKRNKTKKRMPSPRPLEENPRFRDQTEVEDESLGGQRVLKPSLEQPLVSEESGDTWDFQADAQVEDVLEETEQVETAGDELAENLAEYTAASPELSGGDVDADWERAGEGGEEAATGMAPTPDQDRVDEVGQAMGIEYQDDEPLHTVSKLDKRDRERWELRRASGKDQDRE